QIKSLSLKVRNARRAAARALLLWHFADLYTETAQRILQVLVATFDMAEALNSGLPLGERCRDEIGKTGPQIRHGDMGPTEAHWAFNDTAVLIVGRVEATPRSS